MSRLNRCGRVQRRCECATCYLTGAFRAEVPRVGDRLSVGDHGAIVEASLRQEEKETKTKVCHPASVPPSGRVLFCHHTRSHSAQHCPGGLYGWLHSALQGILVHTTSPSQQQHELQGSLSLANSVPPAYSLPRNKQPAGERRARMEVSGKLKPTVRDGWF